MFGVKNILKTNSDTPEEVYKVRQEVVFLILAGFFLGTLAILNILGISRQIDLSFQLFGLNIPFVVFVGVLPYPITFLCTDFISELFGRRRANTVVWIGLALNFWVLFVMWLGGTLPPRPEINPETSLPFVDDPNFVFYSIQRYTRAAIFASMIAYLTAQFVDVYIFHFIKKITKGKYLWLRNNASTLTSQMVDSISVILITYLSVREAVKILPGETVIHGLAILVLSNYVFKMVSALLDTIPFYIGVKFFSKFLNIDTIKEFREEK